MMIKLNTCFVLRILYILIFIEMRPLMSTTFDISGIGGMVGIGKPCPDLFIPDGRVRLRSRGRMAKFVCNGGYQLFGRRLITCLRGRWNFPPPLCISRDCDPLYHPTNGRMSAEMKGSLLRFTCNPGYALVGSPLLYCSGGGWNSTAPFCKTTITNPSLSCDFERSDMCGWSHDYSDDFDWKRYSSSTPSGHIGTGPSYDHTLGVGRNGYYVYIEASSPRKVNDTARLFSPVYPAAFSNDSCFLFWYHMYGAATGSLNVFVKPESVDLDELFPLFSISGNQGNKWLPGFLEVPDDVTEPFQIVIEGVRGTDYSSDTAIDDVALVIDPACRIATTTSVTDTTFISNTTTPVVTWESEELTPAVTMMSSPPSIQDFDEVTNPLSSSTLKPVTVPDLVTLMVSSTTSPPVVTSSSPRTVITASDPSSVTYPTLPTVTVTPDATTQTIVQPLTVRFTNAPLFYSSTILVPRQPVLPTTSLMTSSATRMTSFPLRTTTTTAATHFLPTMKVTSNVVYFKPATARTIPLQTSGPTSSSVFPPTTASTTKVPATSVPQAATYRTVEREPPTNRTETVTVRVTTLKPSPMTTTRSTTTMTTTMSSTTVSSSARPLTTTSKSLPVATTTTKTIPTSRKPLTIVTKIPSAGTKMLPEVTKKLPVTKKPPEVATKLPEVTKKLPEVTKRLPEVTKKLPEVTKKLPEVTKKLPAISKTTASTVKTTPTTSKIVVKPVKPTKYPIFPPVQPKKPVTLKPVLSVTTVTPVTRAVVIKATKIIPSTTKKALSTTTMLFDDVTEGAATSTPSNDIESQPDGSIVRDRPFLPPWVYLNRTEWLSDNQETNRLHPLAPQAQTAGGVLSVPTAVGIAAVAVVALIIVAVVARGIYRRRKVWQDTLTEDSDVRYLKDGEVRVEFHDRHLRED